MPYDNDLYLSKDRRIRYGDEIIKMIGDNIRSENVIVTIQAEFADKPGMYRYIMNKNGVSIATINNEYSASIATYKEYLEWVKDKVDFKKLAIIFLDHGGKLDEICLDEKPTEQFLKIDEIKLTFTNIFGMNSIDLLFLQVCTKGVLDVLYEFKDIAKYTLCSQTLLGAPNYYYPGLFSAFSNRMISTGREVAEIIVANETNAMFNSYTLIDNSKMNNFFTLFSGFVNQTKNMNIILSGTPLNDFYYDERYWDIISFLEFMPNSEYKTRLMEYIKNELIVFHKISLRPMSFNPRNSYSGLSISGIMNDKYNKFELYKLLRPIRDLYKK
jgi:hypothetical protein